MTNWPRPVDWTVDGTRKRMEEIALTIQSMMSMPHPPAVKNDPSLADTCFMLTLYVCGYEVLPAPEGRDGVVSVFLYYRRNNPTWTWPTDPARVSVLRSATNTFKTTFYEQRNVDDGWEDLFLRAMSTLPIKSPGETP